MAGRGWIWAGMVLGALVFGMVGATAGSWVGGISPGPLPGNTEALRLAGEILPGVTPAGEMDRRDYVFGSRLGDEESGPGYVEIPYAPEETVTGDADCRHDAAARANAAEHGWEDFTSIGGYACENWHAQRGNLVLSYTHDPTGPDVTFYRATDGATIGALIGGMIGIAGGAVAVRASRRPVATTLALVVPALVAGPAAALIVLLVTLGTSDGPFPELWTVWVSLARQFFYYY